MLKRFLLILSVFVGVVVAMTVGGGDNRLTGIGRKAPLLSIGDADRELTLDEMRGEYVILNFWTSTDAVSRVAANEYSDWVAEHPEADVSLLSVNFDTSEGLFREIVRRDGMDVATQYHVAGAEAEAIRNNYALHGGYGTVLINPQGKIIAHNPTEAELDKIFRA
jgi:peroxiredoxin